MPWNLLIFPLAAAYYVITRSYLFKFRQQRLDRQRLVFESVLIGTFIAFIAFVLRFSLEFIKPELIQQVSKEFPFKQPFTITSLSTVILSWFFVKLSNPLLDKKKYIGKSIKRLGNELEIILKASFDKKKLLQFTLSSGKVYVGWVKELPIPSVSNYVRIIPAISGYRTNETNEILFTSQYLKVYSEYIQEGKIVTLDQLSSDLILDLNCVIGVSFFDLEMYERFNRLRNGE
ncbi:hypothetical protein U6A24_17360 [Aquimarina gracilis]|uniref:Uncharacterized protein n=1 Tax=Aquimarina gracilis TaxID=874422 RepID=A0ABU5ZZC0_9FLAO|nr:hypothetical protein [Aquimarina gracilis]MEB3347247.1 hypothetical protein [Aquimarina gracilis]